MAKRNILITSSKLKPIVCDTAQRRHLLGRIEEVERGYKTRPARSEKFPAPVRAARKLLAAYDRARDKEYMRRRNALNQARSSAKSVVLFKTPAEAIKAVEKFERMFGK